MFNFIEAHFLPLGEPKIRTTVLVSLEIFNLTAIAII